jgi:hypothetical protein
MGRAGPCSRNILRAHDLVEVRAVASCIDAERLHVTGSWTITHKSADELSNILLARRTDDCKNFALVDLDVSGTQLRWEGRRDFKSDILQDRHDALVFCLCNDTYSAGFGFVAFVFHNLLRHLPNADVLSFQVLRFFGIRYTDLTSKELSPEIAIEEEQNRFVGTVVIRHNNFNGEEEKKCHRDHDDHLIDEVSRRRNLEKIFPIFVNPRVVVLIRGIVHIPGVRLISSFVPSHRVNIERVSGEHRHQSPAHAEVESREEFL